MLSVFMQECKVQICFIVIGRCESSLWHIYGTVLRGQYFLDLQFCPIHSHYGVSNLQSGVSECYKINQYMGATGKNIIDNVC